MVERSRFGWQTLLCFLLVVVAASAARSWYLIACVENGCGAEGEDDWRRSCGQELV